MVDAIGKEDRAVNEASTWCRCIYGERSDARWTGRVVIMIYGQLQVVLRWGVQHIDATIGMYQDAGASSGEGMMSGWVW